jgi:hypothetical protein
MKIIQKKSWITHPDVWRLEFPNPDSPHASARYSFSCNEEGEVDMENLKERPLALQSYQKCVARGPGKVVCFPGGRDRVHAIGRCDCGREVVLNSFTNSCPCGADYNWNGQALACRSQWGEETGEHWTDCY